MTSAEDTADLGFQHPLQLAWGLAADVFIFFWTVLLGSTATILTLLTRKPAVVDVLGRVWCKGIIKACGIEVEVRGLENIDPSRSYVLLCNHLSNFDIWCTIGAVPLRIHFVAKKELLKIPIFGQALAVSDHIVIDRSRPEEAVEIINRRAAGQIGGGFCILFYAEGTRSQSGKVGPFKKGGTVLAMRAGLPLVPMSVSGTRKFLPKRSVIIRPAGKVLIVFDKPIETKGLSLEARDEVTARAREAVVRNYVEEY
jgi:1-acyl-sn-glycerol-3-phosphate acyltransferase